MNIYDALNILGADPNAELSFDDAKLAYRRASSQFHPDRNPAGLEMMKAVNEAWSVILAYDQFPVNLRNNNNNNYGEIMNAALELVIGFPEVVIEICGSWIWLSGETRAVKDQLKEAGYRWAPKKAKWYFRPPEFKSFSKGQYTMDDIRQKYGSQTIQGQYRQQIAA